ncbi:MAG: methyltransferase [Pseudonocardiaceae bacterium]
MITESALCGPRNEGTRPWKRGDQIATPRTRHPLPQARKYLLASVVSGRPAWCDVFGLPFWEDLARRPDVAAVFDRAMCVQVDELGRSLAEAFDWGSVRVVADIGGGLGHVLTTLLNRRPRLRGVLVDLPATIDRASKIVDASVSDRLILLGHDFFDDLDLPDVDTCLLVHVVPAPLP